ncbi:hypothetical protein ACFL59_13770 [Planctomycetota bacterium]
MFLLCWIGFVLAQWQMLTSLSIYFSKPNPGLWYFFSSDTFVFASMYQDLFVDGFAWSSLSLPGAAPSFHHMLLYFILRFVTGSDVTAHVLNAMIEPLLLVLAFLYLSGSVDRRLRLRDRSLMVLTGAVVILLFAHNKAADLRAYFWIARHSGSVMLMLVCCGALLNLASKPRIRHYVVLFLCCGLAIQSNLLFFVIFVAPALATLLVCALLKVYGGRTALFAAAAVAAAAIVGVLLGELAAPSSPLSALLSPVTTRDSAVWGSLLKLLGDSFTTRGVRMYYSLVVVFWIAVAIVLVVRELRRFAQGSEGQRGVVVFGIFSLLMICCNLSAIIITSKPAQGVGYTRYYMPTQTIALFGVAFLVTFLVRQHWSAHRNKVMAVFLVAYFVLLGETWLSSRSWTRSVFSYYPPLTRCLDGLSERYDMRYGIADFWLARYNTIFSKRGLRIYPVWPNLKPYPWLGNKDWYLGGVGARNHDDPIYHFFITGSNKHGGGGLSRAHLRYFGEPIAHESCMGYEVFVYDHTMDSKVKAAFRQHLGK